MEGGGGTVISLFEGVVDHSLFDEKDAVGEGEEKRYDE